MLQSLGGAYTSSQATHLLRMDDGKTIYLKSALVDLKNEKYLGKEVEVMGEIVRTTDGNQTMSVKNIDLIDTEVNSSEDLPEWIDYQSENLGLSLKYRNDYALKESGNEVVLHPNPISEDDSNLKVDEEDLAEIKLSLLSKNDQFDLAAEMGVASLGSSDILAGGYNRSKITQKALDAYKKSSDGGKTIVYYLKNTIGSYRIAFKAGSLAEDLIAEQNMFYDILASIDFSGEPLVEEAVETAKEIDSPQQDQNQETDNLEKSELTEKASEEAVEDDAIESISDASEISGFSTFSSESQKFTIQYPKSYYYGSVAANPGAIRSYQFGSEPLEGQAGEINLDIVKSLPDGGKETEYGGKRMTVLSSGGLTSVYMEQDGKIFKLSASSGKEGLLKQMASTLSN